MSEGEPAIFELIRDSRPTRIRLWSLGASLLINLAALTAMVIAFELSAARRSSERLLSAVQRELSQYRVVLLMPRTVVPATPARPRVTRARRAAESRPLAVPNPRLLQRLDPAIADYVKENPEIESIVTRELVRDIDNKVLDVRRLLKKSSLRVSFELDEAGQISTRKIEKSSGVPSIDHLALELVKLLEKYQMLGAAKGVEKVVVSIDVEQRIEITLEGKALEPAGLESVRKQVQNTLTLMRFALAKDVSDLMLKDVSVTASGDSIVISKSFDKEPLVNFLMRYYQAEPPK